MFCFVHYFNRHLTLSSGTNSHSFQLPKPTITQRKRAESAEFASAKMEKLTATTKIWRISSPFKNGAVSYLRIFIFFCNFDIHNVLKTEVAIITPSSDNLTVTIKHRTLMGTSRVGTSNWKKYQYFIMFLNIIIVFSRQNYM